MVNVGKDEQIQLQNNKKHQQIICFANDTISKVKAKDRLGQNICSTYNRGLILLIYKDVLQMEKLENKKGKEVKKGGTLFW